VAVIAPAAICPAVIVFAAIFEAVIAPSTIRSADAFSDSLTPAM